LSQYSPPPPYQPPQVPGGMMPPPGYPYGYPTTADPGRPARRAGIMMFVLGALAALGGFCGAIFGTVLPQMVAQHPELTKDLPPELTVEAIQHNALVHAVAFGAYGALMILLGFFVRRSRKGAIVASIVLVSLGLLYLGLNFVGAVFIGSQQGPGAALVGGCFSLVPVALCVLLLVWLIQAMRNASAARAAGAYPPEYLAYWQQQYAAQQAYQQQVWQQQQQGGQVPPQPPTPPAVGPGGGDAK
jgi:hypothetical protein